ncbi:MAG: GAF domain-containing protein [Beijerinckiaceae bacterium]
MPNLADDLRALADAWKMPDQPAATFNRAGEIFAAHIGHKLYSVTVFLPGGHEVVRLHSTMPAVYPTGGRKPVLANAYHERVHKRGEAFLGRTVEDFKPYFPDHELIASLGLGSVLNFPVRFDGQSLGSINLLDAPHAYGERHIAPGMAIAAMLTPALLAARHR